MGEGVTQSGAGDVARARRLKKALASGAPPAFVPPEAATVSKQKSCSANSCPLPEVSEGSPQDQDQANIHVQYLEQMFQASPDGLSIADTNHTVLWANETFVRMFGYAASEVMGQSLESLVVPPDRLAESRWVTEALAKGERITLETQRRKKDGSLLEVSVSCAPLLRNGKMAGFYAGYHDISDRKRVETLSSALYRVAEKSSSAHDLQQFFSAVHGIEKLLQIVSATAFFSHAIQRRTQRLDPLAVGDVVVPGVKSGHLSVSQKRRTRHGHFKKASIFFPALCFERDAFAFCQGLGDPSRLG